MEFTYKRDIFKDRFKRQHREKLCSTIVAHLSKDGLMFIHPTQNRSLTPREAARVQTFPDWFQFPVARTHQFRIIGNAVPPLVAEAVGGEIFSFLLNALSETPRLDFSLAPVPSDEVEAMRTLLPLLDKDRSKLRRTSAQEFKPAWYAVAFLYAGLHPDSALDHGETISREREDDYLTISRVEPRLLVPYYERSGWPVILAPIADEAWRRFEADELKDDEFYCSEAQAAGICHRNSKLVKEVRHNRGEQAVA
jgi:DNA (cytosine-5)-methyltransferase 1